MTQAKTGDTVKVHYTGKLENGEVFDSSQGGDPLEFKIGDGQIIAGFESEVVGMEEGESKTINVEAEKGYGQHHDELVVEVGRDQFPPEINPEVGQQLQVKQEDGQTIPVRVTDTSETAVTLDANHPLAGKDLTFDIEVVKVN
ncbi:MAG: peptidylprolyl isomerase [Thermodesulfobacteriota bacterium]|nr:peptidylprolyl isomerase [Thermodesulfobacteriota bacterium]